MRYKDGEPCSHYGCLNHISHPCEEYGSRGVILKSSMECIQNGVNQFVTDHPVNNPWPRTKEQAEEDYDSLTDARKYYSNVDMYRCRNCGSIIILE